MSSRYKRREHHLLKSEEIIEASDKPNNFKVTKESIHSQGWWANLRMKTELEGVFPLS